MRAFNVELAQIRDSTSHPTIAQMRIEFWSNVIDEIYNENNKNAFSYRGQPIAWEIKSVNFVLLIIIFFIIYFIFFFSFQIYKSDENKLSKHWFKKLINSRVDVCVNDFPFNSIQDLENYAESSVSPVYYLLIEYMNFSQQLSPAKRIQLDHIASHTGKAQGIVNMLRGIPFNAKANRCYVPNDLLVKHKISHEDFLRGKQSQNMNDVCYDIACMAKQHTEQAEQLIKQISSNEKLLFLPLYNIRKYLLQLEKYYFNVFHSKLSLRRGMLPLNLWFQSIKIRFGLRWFSNF